MPRVTIGVPVFNSEKTVLQAVTSLLQQSFGDLEVIVSDNASTDGTFEILTELSRQDDRVRVVRRGANAGANENYTSLVALAKGAYFKWASSSDWCAPTFVESCVSMLERDPGVVLVCPSTRTFQETIDDAVDYDRDIGAEQADPVHRFIAVLSDMRLNNAMNGVFRIDALRRTRLIEHFPGSDLVMMAHVALLGRIRLLPDRLYYRKMTPEYATSLQTAEERRRHHYPIVTRRSLLPHWRWYRSQVAAVLSSGLTVSEAARALTYTGRMVRWSRRGLLTDLVEAARYPFLAKG